MEHVPSDSSQLDLEKYLTNGVKNIVKSAIRSTLKDPKESKFMISYGRASRESSKKRFIAKKNGTHIPPFLIASITSSCNLHCAGCYARSNHTCTDEADTKQLTDEEWLSIFLEGKDLGVGFILLAGGEPLIRSDVLKAAGKVQEILFPVFTNGTMINDEYIALFDHCRNLIPIFSMEGQQEQTDMRRGNGVYHLLVSAMERMKQNHLIFGVSVTVTTENIFEVLEENFLDNLKEQGCKVIFYVEYVPVSKESMDLTLQETQQELLRDKIDVFRSKFPEMVFISFPGDEKSSGGCLAAGRGFFHINSHGGAEPCPFSPYSDINVRDTSLKDSLNSKLFMALQDEKILTEHHSGGCVLFENEDKVKRLLLES